MPTYKVCDDPLTIHEDWDKSRWREDSIYLQKYHNLVVPIERQEGFKSLDYTYQKKIIDQVNNTNKTKIFS